MTANALVVNPMVMAVIDVGLFSRKPIVCPVCRTEVAIGSSDRTGFSHFATHLEDTQGPGSPLQLACGCPDAVFDAFGNFPKEVMSHLRDRHHLKVSMD
jgi:hypothetical protein